MDYLHNRKAYIIMEPFSQSEVIRVSRNYRPAGFSMNTMEAYHSYYGIGFRIKGESIISTLDKNFIAPGAIIYNDLHQLLVDYKDETIYIIGGKTIYKLLFPYADELIISTLNKSYNCNVFMSFDLSDFKIEKTLNNDEFVVNYYKRVKNAK